MHTRQGRYQLCMSDALSLSSLHVPELYGSVSASRSLSHSHATDSSFSKWSSPRTLSCLTDRNAATSLRRSAREGRGDWHHLKTSESEVVSPVFVKLQPISGGGVWGLGLDSVLGLGVGLGLRFGVWSLGFGVWGLGFWVG